MWKTLTGNESLQGIDKDAIDCFGWIVNSNETNSVIQKPEQIRDVESINAFHFKRALHI